MDENEPKMALKFNRNDTKIDQKLEALQICDNQNKQFRLVVPPSGQFLDTKC